MGAAEQRNKSQAMAADLLKRGIWHGRRMTSPHPNSGGTTMVFAPGSSKYQRLVARLRASVSHK